MDLKPEVQKFWDEYCARDADAAGGELTVWAFGNTPEMADQLGALVVQGVKTATSSLFAAYQELGERMPSSGEYNIILNGAGDPLCVTRTTEVYVMRFGDVDESIAFAEGEGDRSLKYWREAHERFFSSYGEVNDDVMIVVERFEKLYP